MWFIFLCCIVSSWAYNIDVENAQIYTDPKELTENKRKSYFGFSVALYADPNCWENSLVIVGAPRANVSRINKFTEPGSVFKCPIHSGESCKEWILDSPEVGDVRFQNRSLRDNAWTGANIAIKNGTNPTIVVCAPRSKMRLGQRGSESLFMNGICYRSRVNDSLLFEYPINGMSQNIISPFNQANDKQVNLFEGKYRYFYGMAQAGFSLHMVPNKEDLVLGSPGFFDWKGSPFLMQIEERTPTETEKKYKKQKNLYVQYNNIYDTNYFIANESSIDFNEYFGYSVSSGCYFRDDERWFSSGKPRGDNLNGQVLIFSHPNRTLKIGFKIKDTLTGEQHGEYFGFVLASCDVNKDGKDDLIVGAPLWSNELEEGRVYVFSNKDSDTDYLAAQYIHGEVIRGRFGSAVTCIGDIDYDNYGDVAIGAPYEKDHGAIYIYRGGESGLQLSQKIVGSEISLSILGFGISISEARDIDGNGYPDIAVGAYLSDNAILLRSSPVVTLKVTKINHLAETKLQRNSTFFVIQACFYYTGTYVPEQLNVTLNWSIDEIYARARLSPEANNATVYDIKRTLSKNIESCENFTIYLNSKLQNFMEPITISVALSFDTVHSSLRINSKNGKISKNQFCKTCPVIDKVHSELENSIVLPFALQCRSGDICYSELKIVMSSDLRNNHFVLGSRKTFSVFINISNQGEPAYQSEVQIFIPEPLILASVPPECSEHIGDTTIIKLICNVGNPLSDNKIIQLELSTSRVKCDSNYTLLASTISTTSENLNKKNLEIMVIHFDFKFDILLSGKTQEDSHSFSEKTSENIKFTQIYEIKRFDSCELEEVMVTLKIPTFLEESHKLQIIKIIQTVGLIDNQEFQCSYLNDTFPFLEAENFLKNDSKVEKVTTNKTSETLNIETYSLKYVPPENRTLYINCSNPIISCNILNCKLPGISNSTKIVLVMELQSTVFKSNKLQEKDIIFFVSEGEVTVTKSRWLPNVIEMKTNLTFVETTFIGTPVEQKTALWILILSTILGILLFICLVVVLSKIGFFARKRRKQLRALKVDSKRKRKQRSESILSRRNLD